MNFTFGKYRAVTYLKRPIIDGAPTVPQLSMINHRLNDLSDVLQDSPVEWFLVGGLGTSLAYGEITRNHGDVDIQVSTKDVYQLMNHMATHNYHLFQKLFSTNISKTERFTLYKDKTTDDLLTTQVSRLRFVKTQNGRLLSNVEEPVLPYIDLFLADRLEDGSAITYAKGKAIHPRVEYTNPSLVVQRGDKQIKLVHPAYHAAIIQNSSGKKNDMNRRVLDELLADERFRV